MLEPELPQNFSITLPGVAVDRSGAAKADLLERYDPKPSQILTKIKRALFSPYALAIIVLSLVAITVAYQFRPVMYINLGGGYDTPYLDGFASEVRPERNAVQAGDITDENTPAPAKNDPSIVVNNAGKAVPEPVIDNYRWTTKRSIVLLPGAGASPSKLTIRAAASPLYPQGQQVQMLLNGRDFASFKLLPGQPTSQVYNFGPEYYQNGNMAVEFRVTSLGNRDPNIYFDAKSEYNNGFKFYDLWLEPQSGGFVMPEYKTLLGLVASWFMLYLLLAYSGVARLVAFSIAALFSLASVVTLAVWRLELTIFVTRLALLLVVAGLALIIFDLLIPRLFRWGQLPLPSRAWTVLMVLFLWGMFLRGGGTLYPQTVIIDERWHLNVINRILDEPGGAMYELTSKDSSKVPAQWGSSAIIPYTPFVHFYLAPFAALPIEREVTVNLVNIFLDAARVLVIYALALALGAGVRGALAAAGIYSIIPSTYLLNSWGNWPTTVSFWLAVLYLTLALVNYRKLNRLGIWLGLTILLVMTMLAYSVTMIFMGMLLYFWAIGLFFFAHKSDPLARRNAKLVFASATVAALASVAIYYWQFISDLLPTLTSFNSSLNTGEGLGLGERSFFDYLWLYTDHVFIGYGVGVFLTLALAVFGFAIFAPKRVNSGKEYELDSQDTVLATLRSPKNLWFAGSWFLVFVIFGLAQWKVDMVDKQVWFAVPLIVALAGPALVFLWSKAAGVFQSGQTTVLVNWLGRIAVALIVAWISYSALSLWIYRIFFKRH